MKVIPLLFELTPDGLAPGNPPPGQNGLLPWRLEKGERVGNGDDAEVKMDTMAAFRLVDRDTLKLNYTPAPPGTMVSEWRTKWTSD